ncbi:hypothetical protein C8R43DRAFT_1230556 [Mycena crocata]|nr:hypothetical protein C8R43DRAFT_1230556 [Mycena crocata]
MLSFITLTTSVLLLSVTVATAQDDGGLSADQQCLLTCSTDAAKASGCQLGDNACFCSSNVYISGLTDCSTKTCSFTDDQVKGLLADGCAGVPSGSASAAPSASAGDSEAPVGPSSASGASSDTPSSPSGSAPASNPSKSAAGGGSNSVGPTPPASGSAPVPSQSGNSAAFMRLRTEMGGVLAASIIFYTLFV